jgi:chromosome segregation ATPase
LGPVLTKAQVKTSENKNRELTQRVQQQVTRLNTSITELRSQVSTLTAERDALKTQSHSTNPQGSPDLKSLQDRIVGLQQEKASLETSLNEVRAKATELSNQTATLVSEQRAGPTIHLIGFQASVQKERDSLLAEKESWTKSAAPSATEGTPSAQVLRERDEALANCKVSHLRPPRIQFSTRPTESAGAGESAEEPTEAELHADREQQSSCRLTTAH